MITKEILYEYSQLLKHCDVHYKAIKSRLELKYYDSFSGKKVEEALQQFENFIKNLKSQQLNFKKLLDDLSQDKKQLMYYKQFNSHNKKKPYRNKKKEDSIIKEPNENLINNKHILSGGAWESNRRKH